MTHDHQILRVIVRDFEALGALLERTIETFAADDSGSLDVDALHRAKHAALHGAELARKSLPEE